MGPTDSVSNETENPGESNTDGDLNEGKFKLTTLLLCANSLIFRISEMPDPGTQVQPI